MNTLRTTKPIPSLLRRTQLLPDESLPSLLERLAQLNYYPSLRILSDICLDPPEALGAIPDNLACPQWAETFLRLAELTRISPEDLYAASNHRFAPFLNSPGQTPLEIPWMGSNLQSCVDLQSGIWLLAFRHGCPILSALLESGCLSPTPLGSDPGSHLPGTSLPVGDLMPDMSQAALDPGNRSKPVSGLPGKPEPGELTFRGGE